MAVGMSSYLANKVLDAMCNNTSLAVTSVYIKLHIGDPGSAGTANAAAETTRKLVSFGVAASGAVSNDAQIQWTSVTGSEDYTHYSAWDALSSGNFLWSGTVTSDAVTAGDMFTIPVGDLDLNITLAS
jgi:hypothetical protein